MTTPAEPTPVPAVPAAPAPAEPAKPEPAKTTPAAPAPTVVPAEETPEQKIERLEAALKAANNEAAKARKTKQGATDEARAALAQEIGKAIGLVEDETVDPAKLAEQVSAATAEAKQAKAELAVFHAAATAGADATALLDSRTFMAKLADIDPSDTAAVTAAIAEAVKANPGFAAVTTPRLPAPNPALGSSGSGAPDNAALIEQARKSGDWKTVVALENQKLLNAPK